MKTITGMYMDEPNEVYHANKEYDSFSNLKTAIRSPELYKKTNDGLLPEEHKDAWDIGNAVHTAILEPMKLGMYYFTDETFNGATKAGKAIKKECEESGKMLLNATNSRIYQECSEAIFRSNAIKLFKEGDPEVTWRVSNSNIKLQCRTDWICHDAPEALEEFGIEKGERYVADLKTTQSLDDWFNNSQWKNPLTNDFFYAGQETFYKPIINSILSSAGEGQIDKWVFVIVEKKEPFRVAVINTPSNVLEWAEGKVNKALIDIINRKKSSNWTDERCDGVYEPDIRLY